jgi:hypothetical protein
MGREILRPGVGLDFDDASLTPPGLVIADEPGTEQARGDDLRGAGKPLAIEDAQAGVW